MGGPSSRPDASLQIPRLAYEIPIDSETVSRVPLYHDGRPDFCSLSRSHCPSNTTWPLSSLLLLLKMHLPGRLVVRTLWHNILTVLGVFSNAVIYPLDTYVLLSDMQSQDCDPGGQEGCV